MLWMAGSLFRIYQFDVDKRKLRDLLFLVYINLDKVRNTVEAAVRGYWKCGKLAVNI